MLPSEMLLNEHHKKDWQIHALFILLCLGHIFGDILRSRSGEP